MLKEFLEAGRIVGTHGIKGELRVDPWCDSPDFLAQFKTLYTKDGAQALEVISSRVHKNLLLVQLKGIDTIEQGDRMRGKVLFIKRSDVTLPKGRLFYIGFAGLEVYNADDETICYGAITDVIKTGANDVYQITDKQQKNYLIPVIDQVVIDTDIQGRKLLIRPMKGIFEDED